MSMGYQGTTIWITGASSGIGKALALELHQRGATLLLSSRKKESLEAVRQACAHPERVHLIPLDLQDYTSLKDIAQGVLQDHGSIDYLVNNGGISQRAYAVDTQLLVDAQIMDVNFMGTVALTKAVLPHMQSRKQGKIVTVTSMVGKYGTPMRSSYAASKHALHGFMDALRAEVWKAGVKVQLICPGYVQTQISMNAVTGDGSAQQQMDKATAQGIPADRFARKMADAMLRDRPEVYICGAKERAGLYLKRFFPRLFNKLVRKVNVT